MTARTAPQANGVPTWLDFWVADPEATRHFWIDLLGYTINPGEEQFGHYTVALQERDGQPTYVFGIGPAMPGFGHDLAALYFATDDLDARVATARDLGATVLVEPMDIPGHGRMAALTDPTGAVFALWQAAGIVGYGAVDEPGFPTWQDLVTTDPAAARTFYVGLFGYDVDDSAPEGTVVKLGDDAHFTIGPAQEGAESHWVSYLHTDDLDGTVARARELGATVTAGPEALPFGTWVHLETPGGAPFGLFQAAEAAQG